MRAAPKEGCKRAKIPPQVVTNHQQRQKTKTVRAYEACHGSVFRLWFVTFQHLYLVLFYVRSITYMTLTKANLVDQLNTSHTNISKNQAREAVETLLELIKSNLENGDNVLLSGFGKFSIKDKRQRKGRNPQTGEELIIDARRVVTFKPSGNLKDKVNGK
jgi:integration host factor subunit alpha